MLPSLQTLFLPLESGDVTADGPVLFLGADFHPLLGGIPALDAWQVLRPLADNLGAHGLKSSPDMPGGRGYRLALVHLPKQAEESKYWLARALQSLEPGGVLLAAAANDAGGARLANWFKEAGLTPESFSKNKARAVWATRPDTLPAILDQWLENGSIQDRQIGDGLLFKTQPGIFSWDRIDKGSRLLASYIPPDIKGISADFGSGNGYLSHMLLHTNAFISEHHLAEADHRALTLAKDNLKNVQGGRPLHFHWTDLSKPIAGLLPPLDFVLMNPPFHTGRKSDIDLGQAFIERAASALKKGGTMLMVANVHLPYEDLCRKLFSLAERLEQKDGFKIIRGIK